MQLHRLAHVLRTGGMKTAGGRQQRRDPPLVEPQKHDHCPLHRWNTFCTSARSSSNGAVSKILRGLKTTDHLASSPASCSRTHSRSRRLMRFRYTALPTARGTVKPTRGRSCSASARQNAVKQRPVIRKPCEYTVRKSLDLRIRDRLGNKSGLASGLLGVTNGSFVTDGQLVAATSAAARQHSLPILGLHSRSEPVGLRPLAIIRLKCTFWHFNFLRRRADYSLRSTTIAQNFGLAPRIQYKDSGRRVSNRPNPPIITIWLPHASSARPSGGNPRTLRCVCCVYS